MNNNTYNLSEQNLGKLREAYTLFARQLRYNRGRKLAMIISDVMFFMLSVLAFLGLCGRPGIPDDIAYWEQIPALSKLSQWLAFPDLEWSAFFVLELIFVAAIPFAVFLLVLCVYTACNRKEKAAPLSGDGKTDTETVCAAGRKAGEVRSDIFLFFLFKCGLQGGIAGILYCTVGVISGTIAEGTGFSYWFAAVITCLILVFVITVIWLVMSLPLCLMRLPFETSSKKCKRYNSLASTLEGNWNAVEKAREKAQKEAREKEKAARKEEERRRKEEKRQQEAQQAEEAFHELESPSEQQDKVKHLAKAGSPSACAVAGQTVYLDYCNNPHTKVEKEALVKEAKDYLEVSASAGNVESQFLLLSLRAMSEAHVYSEWDALLKEARAIQRSGELPERYSEPMTDLQQAIVDVMDRTPVDTAQKEAPKDEKPRVKRTYCKFCASGACTYYSTGSYLAKCSHLNDPGNCFTALTEKGYTVEFY